MKNNDDAIMGFVTFVIVIFVFLVIAAACSSGEDEYKSKCIRSSCDRECTDGSLYCFLHKPSSTNSYNTNSGSSSTYDSHTSYDDGYNDIYDDADYDWDRYQEDDDYASGVDDAMDEWNEEYGEDW